MTQLEGIEVRLIALEMLFRGNAHGQERLASAAQIAMNFNRVDRISGSGICLMCTAPVQTHVNAAVSFRTIWPGRALRLPLAPALP